MENPFIPKDRVIRKIMGKIGET
jgi:hypothetical protein